MSTADGNRTALGLGGESREADIGRASIHDHAMLEELKFVWREAQAEANLAHEDWRRSPCRDTYAVYLAARDRADAGQDELANWARHIAA